MLREPFQREHVSQSICVWKNLNSHQNTVHLCWVTDLTAKIVMTLALVLHTTFYNSWFRKRIFYLCNFFLTLSFPILLYVKRHESHKGLTVLKWTMVSDVPLHFIHPQAGNLPGHSTFNAKILTGVFMVPNTSQVCGLTSYTEIFTVCIETRNKYPQTYKLKTSNNIMVCNHTITVSNYIFSWMTIKQNQ